MKLMIAGGGTGGHLFPAIAVARAWLAEVKNSSVFFVGTERGIETTVVPKAGFRLLLIRQSGLKNRGFRAAIAALFEIPRSLLSSLSLVRRERPSVALSVGGYAAGPAILAAWLLGVPCVVLEPNAMPGLTNRWLGRVATIVISPYARAKEQFAPAKLRRRALPVRAELGAALATAAAAAGHEKALLVFGGSQGARALNDATIAAAPELMARGYSLTHQTGAKEFERVREAYQGLRVDCVGFIDDMAEAYSKCKLVVCRAGASTLAELAIVGRPSVLVPLPTAADDHQSKNALAFAATGAARVLPQAELNGPRLLALVEELMADPNTLEAMATAARRQGDSDASAKVAAIVAQVAQRQSVAPDAAEGPA